MVFTHRHCSKEGPAETVLPEATQEVKPSKGAAGHLQHCHHSICPVIIHLILVWLIHKTGQSGLQRESSGLTFPPSRTYTGLGSGKGQLKLLQTPHTLHINCLGFYLQVAPQIAVC
ncbi:hypothetical protein AMECASPLE_039291 [Ameca splendens]|uniref:Uncharacterized protein n=1 Tax=Ameca splendens TaxID=208324 RepID=A0ABV0XXB6_9TELE